MFAEHELLKPKGNRLWGHLKDDINVEQRCSEKELEDLIPPPLTNHPRSNSPLESHARKLSQGRSMISFRHRVHLKVSLG